MGGRERVRDGADVRILSEELSVCAGELETLLLRWDEGRLPGLLPSSREGAGEGLSGTRSCHTHVQTHTRKYTHIHSYYSTPSRQPAADSSENIFSCLLLLLQRLSRCYSNGTERRLLIPRSSIFPLPPSLCLSPPFSSIRGYYGIMRSCSGAPSSPTTDEKMCTRQRASGTVCYLNHWCHHSGRGILSLCCGGHIGDGGEVVHLTHCHGDWRRRQADRDQGVGHHHEWQFQTWARRQRWGQLNTHLKDSLFWH